MRLPKPTLGKVLAGTAVLLLVTTGGAYAAATVTSADIVDHTIQSIDIKNGAVRGVDILNGTVQSVDVADESLTSTDILDATLTDADLASNSVGEAEIKTDGVNATEIADNSIDSGEIVDFSLTNQDIGVLFAQVNAAGGLDNQCSGCGVSALKLGTGNYEIDFSRNISACAFTATVAPSGAGSALGEVNVADRAGNVEAVFVDTNNSDGSAADKPFNLMVVC